MARGPGPSLPPNSPKRRSSTLAAARRYYPGFFAALFLVLLRMAIGWHFVYEGLTKIYSTTEGRNSRLTHVLPPRAEPPPVEKAEGPFSAEVYLRNASGPFAPYFRRLVPDVDSRNKLVLDRLKGSWTAELATIAPHYRFTPAQRAAAEKDLNDRVEIADDWFRDLENRQKVKKYFDDLDHYLAVEQNGDALASERSAAYKKRTEIDADRRALVQTVDAWTGVLHDSWMKLVTPEQARSAGPLPVVWTRMDTINALTMYGLAAVGLCLLLGFCTPLAALGGVAYLALFYLSMPPWPGVPPGPMAEGHYLYVNKNLIELLACLVLASTPNGLWCGVDALLFGWLSRRRAAR